MSEPKDKERLQSEIRYAIRLCERTARFYRKIQAIGTFFTVIGGSAAITTLSPSLPPWVSVAGTILLAISGSALLAIRPAEKASSNENDVKRYQAMMTKSHGMDAKELQVVLDEAHQGGAPEIDALRLVAYNDVVLETGRPDCLEKLSLIEKLFQHIA
jgi:hypothetical protein